MWAYIRTTRVLEINAFVILEKYGSGPQSLLWGQLPTLKRQIESMERYEMNEEKRKSSDQRGNENCDFCGHDLGRNMDKKKVHRIACAKLRVQGVVDRYKK